MCQKYTVIIIHTVEIYQHIISHNMSLAARYITTFVQVKCLVDRKVTSHVCGVVGSALCTCLLKLAFCKKSPNLRTSYRHKTSQLYKHS